MQTQVALISFMHSICGYIQQDSDVELSKHVQKSWRAYSVAKPAVHSSGLSTWWIINQTAFIKTIDRQENILSKPKN
jgi:hypothetical protein